MTRKKQQPTPTRFQNRLKKGESQYLASTKTQINDKYQPDAHRLLRTVMTEGLSRDKPEATFVSGQDEAKTWGWNTLDAHAEKQADAQGVET